MVGVVSAVPSLVIVGSRGRMGQALFAAAAAAGVPVAAGVDQGDDLAAAAAAGDVLVDFSHHTATAGVIESARRLGKRLVIGTTGHDPATRARLQAEAAAVPCVWSGNYSVGVNLLFHLTATAARILADGFDVEVIEMHHRFKKDAPSGTAERLLEVLRAARGLGPEHLRHGRHGIVGERSREEIGVHALRGGDVVGDHTVLFAALGERFELTHKASDRAIFARGAVAAARWVQGRPPGVYDMQDVLGLREEAPGR